MEALNNFANSFEEYLKTTVAASDTDYKILTDSMNYSLLNAGKRIRPFMLCEFYKASGGTSKEVYKFAAALEMIHTYSLIHDDLPCMDNDDFRRGKPSNHKKFGEDIALLAGDALLTHAFFTAASAKEINSEYINKAIKKLAFYAGTNGMVAGQVIDLLSEEKNVGIETVEKLNVLKTGALLKAACDIGCILAGADEVSKKSAVAFGEKIGLAFQIIDDILDKTADEKLLGKPVGSDAKNKKSTFVSIYGIDYCKKYANDLTDEAIDALDNFKGDTSVLEELAEYLTKRKF